MEKKLPKVNREELKTDPRKNLRGLFLLIGLLFGVFFMISWGFGWMAFEKPSIAELRSQAFDGRLETKRMAVLEWSRQLLRADERKDQELLSMARPDTALTLRLLEVLKQGYRQTLETPDSNYLAGSATVLGFSQNPQLAESGLRELLQEHPQSLSFVQIYILLSLGRLGSLSPESVEQIALRLDNLDSALRKTAVYVLGSLKDERLWIQVADRVAARLYDSEEDVRWNAALALALHKDLRSSAQLLEILEKAERSGQEGEAPFTEALLSLYSQAFDAVVALSDPKMLEKLNAIADSHKNLKLRQAAKSALAP